MLVGGRTSPQRGCTGAILALASKEPPGEGRIGRN